MKVFGRREIILTVCGAILSFYSFKYWGLSPSYIAGGNRMMTAMGDGLYFIIGFLVSVTYLFTSWKKKKMLSLIPLAITLGFSWLSFSAPRVFFPPRDPAFLEAHSVDYRKCVDTFEKNTASQTDGRFSLPAAFKDLSEDGRIWVIIDSDKKHVNYYFLYQKGFNSYQGVVYTPDGHLIISYEFAEPMNEAGWYYAGFY